MTKVRVRVRVSSLLGLFNNTGSSKRACASIYLRFSSLLACVYDSAPISGPIFIKFGRYIHFTKNKNKFISWCNWK